MPAYDATSIIEASLEELSYIAELVSAHEVPVPRTVLIGGWAVHSYNAWYGSIDIDLITDSRGRKRITDRLTGERGFQRNRDVTDRRWISKPVPPRFNIIIDFGNRDHLDPFEGTDQTMDYSILDGRTIEREIAPGRTFIVPERTLLIVFKLKAAWDRRQRLLNGASHDPEWERGKLLKDRGDLLALLDPTRGGYDVRIDLLGRDLDRWPFLKGTLFDTLIDNDALKWYGRMGSDTVRDLSDRLGSLLE